MQGSMAKKFDRRESFEWHQSGCSNKGCRERLSLRLSQDPDYSRRRLRSKVIRGFRSPLYVSMRILIVRPGEQMLFVEVLGYVD